MSLAWWACTFWIFVLSCHVSFRASAFSVFPTSLPSSALGLNTFSARNSVVNAHRPERLKRIPPAFTSAKWKASAIPTFEKFDYKSHWYPVSWAVDLPANRPTKVTIFDVDYVVTRLPVAGAAQNSTIDDKFEVLAMLDACPHKSASLSEGRVTSTGAFQCGYHGWTFNGKSGKCTQIPQIIERFNDEGNALSGLSNSDGSTRRREDGKAVPAMISQGMVWLFPYGGLERALQAPPPPRVPEIDMAGFKVTPAVRDFPVDWPVLIENILDPDHGLFAHQNVNFDLYSATPGNHPQTITEEAPILSGDREHVGWRIASEVNAVPKLVEMDTARRKRLEEAASSGSGIMAPFAVIQNVISPRPNSKEKESASGVLDPKSAPVKATSYYVAPSLIVQCRRDPAKENTTSFLTCFWICPTGTGKSRFMSAAVGPMAVPRWLIHLNLNNFLDQDTYLLATQHRNTLAAEAEALEEAERASPVEEGGNLNVNVRKKLYVYRSPTERIAVRLGQFFDSTLARAPNRRATLLNVMGGSARIRHTPVPSRAFVLDRYEQHTSICPDSMSTVNNCRALEKGAKALALVLVVAKALSLSLANAAIKQLGAVLTPTVLGVSFAVLGAVAWAAKRIQREFVFKYGPEFRNRDMDKIPSVWMDA